MRRLIWALAATAVLAGGVACGSSEHSVLPTAAAVDSVLPRTSDAWKISIDTLARGLEVPWGVALAPDGRIFVSERAGRIRVVQDGVLLPAPWATLDVFAQHLNWGPESGLLGIALAPDFAASGQVYVLATVWRSEGDRRATAWRRLWRRAAGAVSPEAGLVVKNQIVRFTEMNGRGTQPTIIVDDLPTSHYHAGGGLAFGPDGKLYASLGDATKPALSSAPTVLVGKILRLERDGSVPRDNPDPRSPVWVRGLRNTQAFTWLADGTMFGVEHGPSGMLQEHGRVGHDELNELIGGRDYGWPRVVGWSPDDASAQPVWVWSAGIAPAGIAALPADTARTTTTLLIGSLRGRRIERMEVARDPSGRWRAVTRETLIGADWGRVRTLVAAPDGFIYATTSNRDVRGSAGPVDDLLLRLRATR